MPRALPKTGFDDLATLFPKIAEEADGWDPSTVKPGSSSKKRYWKCPIGHSYQATPKSRTSSRTGCPYCAGRKVLVGFNDLQSKFPEVASQAHGWDPTSVTAHSGQKRDWKCPQGHLYATVINDRSNGVGCPYCDGKKVLAGFNDLLTCNPDAASWAYGWDPSSVTPKSNRMLEWKCPRGHIFLQRVSNRSKGDGCLYCSKYGRGILPGENDLKSRFPEIAKEAFGWDPSSVRAHTHLKKSWKCPLGHIYTSRVQNRTQLGAGCPFCSGKEVLEGFNDLNTTVPEIANEAYGWDPKMYTRGSIERMEWKCLEGHIYRSTINSRTRTNGSGCPVCAKYGFNAEAESWLYLMERPGEQQIGITNNLKQRIRQHERNGWYLLDQVGPSDGRLVLETETALKRWMRQAVQLLDGTDENWATSEMEVSSLAELKAKSSLQTDLL